MDPEGVLFLDRRVDDGELKEFFAYSKIRLFRLMRETQYEGLERRIILEENISKSENINDYKFFCTRGHVLYCQVDVDRFTEHKRAICTIPDFEIVPVRTRNLKIPGSLERPVEFAEMVRIASELSMDFDFVRIDLYDVEDGIFFGEYTFSPCAGCDKFSNEAFAVDFLSRVTSLIHDRKPQPEVRSVPSMPVA